MYVFRGGAGSEDDEDAFLFSEEDDLEAGVEGMDDDYPYDGAMHVRDYYIFRRK